MSSPSTADLSASSPSALLGDPSAATVPQIRIPRGSSSRRRSHGFLGRDWSGRSPRAPLPPQQRQAAGNAAKVIRPQPKEAQRQTPPADRPRTAAGAPADRPRQVPKTGRTERYRDAMRHVLGKDAEHQYHGMPAASQEVMNKIMREHGGQTTGMYDLSGRATMQDHLDYIRGTRKSNVADAVRRAREAQDAPPEDKGPVVEHGPRERSPERTEAHRIALEKLRKSKEALDE